MKSKVSVLRPGSPPPRHSKAKLTQYDLDWIATLPPVSHEEVRAVAIQLIETNGNLNAADISALRSYAGALEQIRIAEEFQRGAMEMMDNITWSRSASAIARSQSLIRKIHADLGLVRSQGRTAQKISEKSGANWDGLL